MNIRTRHLGCSAVALLISGTAAVADVTAEQVWTDFRSYLEGMGYSVSGSESRAGSTLTIADVVLGMDNADGSGGAQIGMDSIAFSENGDGTVRVLLPEEMPITFNATPPADAVQQGGGPVEGAITYRQTGFDMVVSGDPADMVYDYSADTMGFTLDSLIVDGTTLEIAEARMQLADMVGRNTVTGTSLRTIAQDMTVGSATYMLDMANPEDPTGRVLVSGGLNDLAFEGTIAMPEDVDTTDLAAAMRAGFALEGGYSYAGGNSDFTITTEGDTVEGTTKSDTGTLTVRMQDSTMAYSGTATGVALNYAGTAIPLPVSLTMGETGFNMVFPVAQTEEPTDFALGLTLEELALSDTIWGLIDPAGQLPRDPATLVLDLSGTGRLTEDLTDSDGTAATAGAFPGELNTVAINALQLALAGAELVGDGAFTFDNTDLSTFPGMPKPTGAVDLQLTGGSQLLDTLVAMGILPQEQAMGARMMLGLFARPGDGPDTLTSRIEINEEGQVLANGQRLR